MPPTHVQKSNAARMLIEMMSANSNMASSVRLLVMPMQYGNPGASGLARKNDVSVQTKSFGLKRG